MKKIFLAITTLLTVALLAGCGASKIENTATITQSQNGTNTDTETAVTEVKITHSRGETVVPVNPKKVVVFDMGVLDTMDSLGIDVEFAIPVANLTTYLSKYETAVNAGGIKEPNIEKIYEFDPDVIFISARQMDFYDELSAIAPTVYVDLNADTYIEDFSKTVTYIGQIFNKETEAEEALTRVNIKIEDTKTKVQDMDDNALIILTNDGNMSAYGKGSRFGIIHDVLQVKPADDNIQVSTHGNEASYEYLLEVNPDILFVIDRTTVVGGTNLASSTLDNDLVKATNAYINNRIVYLDAETWYIAGAGITAIEKMVDDVATVVE